MFVPGSLADKMSSTVHPSHAELCLHVLQQWKMKTRPDSYDWVALLPILVLDVATLSESINQSKK